MKALQTDKTTLPACLAAGIRLSEMHLEKCGTAAALRFDPAVSQVAVSEEAGSASAEEQRSLHSAALTAPPLTWQQLTPQLFSLLAQGKVGITLASSGSPSAMQRTGCTLQPLEESCRAHPRVALNSGHALAGRADLGLDHCLHTSGRCLAGIRPAACGCRACTGCWLGALRRRLPSPGCERPSGRLRTL